MTLGQVVTFRGQLGIGKVSSRPCEYFGIVGLILALLGEPQSAVQILTSWPLMTSGGRTAGCDGVRFDMWTTLVMVHIMCKFQLDLRCPEYGLNLGHSTPWPLMTSGGQTAGRDGKRFYTLTTYLLAHLVCNFQLDPRCHAHSLFLRCTSSVGRFWHISYYHG